MKLDAFLITLGVSLVIQTLVAMCWTHRRMVGLAWRYRRERNLTHRRLQRVHRQAVLNGQELHELQVINNVLVSRSQGQAKWIGKQMLANAARTQVPDHLPEEL